MSFEFLFPRSSGAQLCRQCGKPVGSNCILVKGQAWHAGCFTCQHCKKPLISPRQSMPHHWGGTVGPPDTHQYVEHQNGYYHVPCYAKAFDQHCDVCAKALVGRVITDGRGYRYCAHHVSQLPRCFSCQRLICRAITGGGVKLSDGRSLCQICKLSAITDTRQAHKAFDQAKVFLKRLTLDLSEYDIPLSLTDQHRIGQPHRELAVARPVCGLTKTQIKKRQGEEIQRTVTDISILHHLSRVHFTSIAVHELCHAWLFYNRFSSLPPRVEEGMCVFMEYSYLKYTHDHEAAEGSTLRKEAAFLLRLIEENQDPIYGDGFRSANEAVIRHGLPATLQALKAKQYWPGTSPLRDDLKYVWRKLFSF